MLLMVCIGCTADPKKAIVGKWKEKGNPSFEFFPDGTVTSLMTGAGTFSFPDATHIKLSFSIFGGSSTVAEYSLSGNTLTLVLPGQQKTVLQRDQ